MFQLFRLRMADWTLGDGGPRLAPGAARLSLFSGLPRAGGGIGEDRCRALLDPEGAAQFSAPIIADMPTSPTLRCRPPPSVLEPGRIVRADSASGLADDPELEAAYLGRTEAAQ